MAIEFRNYGTQKSFNKIQATGEYVAMSCRCLKLLTTITTVGIAACATTNGSFEPPIVEFYQQSKIIVPTGATGVLTSTDGCVRFVQQAGVLAVQFPKGTIYSPADAAIVMPNGRKLPFGKRLTLDFQAPPNAKSVVPACGGLPAIQVLRE